jgi:hypothetical protein
MVFLRLIPIRVARLMRHHTHSFPIPGLSDCVETPALSTGSEKRGNLSEAG